MNTNSIFYFFNNFSKDIIYFVMLFVFINIEASLNFFLIFDNSTPSLLSIVIFLSLRKFSIHFSSLMLFVLGILYDIILGSNIGINSIFFLLIKYFTLYLNLSFIEKDVNDDWIYFTFIFISSFVITFALNIFSSLSIPDLSPVLFHIGATLIIFPLIFVSINFIYFITKLIKN